jgi:hypothetical protein
MVVLALLLVAAVVVFAVLVITNGGAPATLDVEFFKVHTTVAGVFLSGLGTFAVLAVAWWMLRIGLRHSRRRRAEVKRLRGVAAEHARRGPEPGATEPARDVDTHFDSTPREGS